MAVEFTEANFEELVINSDKPVLVDFWAEWCGPCRMVGPLVDQLHDEYEGKAVIGKVNVDHNQAIATKYIIVQRSATKCNQVQQSATNCNQEQPSITMCNQGYHGENY